MTYPMADHFNNKPTVLSKCPKTAVWLNAEEAAQCSDPIGHEDNIRHLVFPVMIHGERNTHAVYELSDVLNLIFTQIRSNRQSENTSPVTRRPFVFEQLEPVRYPGFRGYNNTVGLLKRITNDEWNPVPDPNDVPTVEDGQRMPTPPGWLDGNGGEGDQPLWEREINKILEYFSDPLYNEILQKILDLRHQIQEEQRSRLAPIVPIQPARNAEGSRSISSPVQQQRRPAVRSDPQNTRIAPNLQSLEETLRSLYLVHLYLTERHGTVNPLRYDNPLLSHIRDLISFNRVELVVNFGSERLRGFQRLDQDMISSIASNSLHEPATAPRASHWGLPKLSDLYYGILISAVLNVLYEFLKTKKPPSALLGGDHPKPS